MRNGRLARTMWLAAVVPLFLAAVFPDQVRTLVCRFSGAVMDEDCCPPVADEAVETQARLRDDSCCAIKTIDLARLVSDRRVEPASHRYYELRAHVPNIRVSDRSTMPAGLALIRYVAPPHVGPPIVLLKHCFLI